MKGQDRLVCSQSPHDETVVARCAQFKTTLPLADQSGQLHEEGFLSPEIGGVREQIRVRHASHFDLVRRVKVFCQETDHG